MREWIVFEDWSTARLRQICETLDAAPQTAVIRATRNACDRALSLVIDIEEVKEDAGSDCVSGNIQCRVLALRRLRTILGQATRVFVTYNRDIEAVLADGPCRAILASAEDLEDYDEELKEFDVAVAAFANGDSGPIEAWSDDDEDDDLDDPTPCRPS